MTIIATAITFIRGSRNAQIVLLVVTMAAAAIIALKIHDEGVRREAVQRLEAKAQEQAAKAGNVADAAQEVRNDAYEATRVDNAVSVSSYLDQLHAKQCSSDPAACRKADVRR